MVALLERLTITYYLAESRVCRKLMRERAMHLDTAKREIQPILDNLQ